MHPVYILGSAAVSPQQSWNLDLLTESVSRPGNRMACLEPDYAMWLDAKQLRRMSRVMKMAAAAAMLALKNANVAMPDAIITGTGLGCLDDTGSFLNKIIEYKEEALNPTPFIQSTHNTIGSHIAFLLQCQAYNQTYSHDAFSFESALLDGMLHCSENPNQKILTGSADEITDVSHQIIARFGIFKKNSSSNQDIFKSKTKGTIHGEGSAWFVLSGQPEHSNIILKGVKTIFRPTNIQSEINSFLSRCDSSASQVDLVLTGKSGDLRLDSEVDLLSKILFAESSTGVYKHLCGEYHTASSFALWLAISILKTGLIPSFVLENDAKRLPKLILLYNRYFNDHHSLILLSKNDL